MGPPQTVRSSRRLGLGSYRAARKRLGTLTVVFFLIVVGAAGVSGLTLLAFPGSTGSYFSWTLRPTGAAALIGGLYLASAVIFGFALMLPWRQARALVVGVFGLAVPTLALTLVFDEVFDFGRWQAIAWLTLFLAAPLTAAVILATAARDGTGGPLLRPGSRVVLLVLAAVFAVVAVLVWADGTRPEVARYSPVDLVRLTGSYLGAWSSFLAVLCGWAAVRGRWDDARVPLATLGVAGAGTLLGLLRVGGDVRHPVPAMTVCLCVVALASAMYWLNAPRSRAGGQEEPAYR